MKRLHAVISGKVQGVFFRAHTQEKAQELGLTGWVQNIPNGRVELIAEGPEEQLHALLEWCREGSEQAVVDRIEESWSDAHGDQSTFEIKR